MNERSISTENPENPFNKREQVSVGTEVESPEKDNAELNLDSLNIEIRKQEEIISDTSRKVNEIRHNLGLSGEETDIPSVALNVQKISSFKERLKLFSGIPEAIKKFFRASLISAVLTSGFYGEALGQQVPDSTAGALDQKDKGSVTATISPETPEVVGSKENLSISAETIKGYVFSDTHERAFLSKKNSESYFVANESEENADNMKVNLRVIEIFCEKQKTKDVSLVHTHPIALYTGIGYSDKEIKETQSGELIPYPMAPSILDLQGITQTYDSLEKKGIKMNGKIFDPAGVWEYRVSEKNINKFNKYKEVIEKIQRLAPKMVAQLSPEEREIFAKMGNVHQEKILQTLQSNEETRDLAEKIEEILERDLTEIAQKYPEVLKAVNSVNELGYMIANFNRFKVVPGSNFNEFMDKYKLATARLGFEIKYTPYPNKNSQ